MAMSWAWSDVSGGLVRAGADDDGDDVSVDLLTQRLGAHEKFAWMLRSTLGGR